MDTISLHQLKGSHGMGNDTLHPGNLFLKSCHVCTKTKTQV